MITETAIIFDVGRVTARALLEQRGYDMTVVKTLLSEAWFDGVGKAAVLRSVGEVEQTSAALDAPGATIECQVCYDDCEAKDITGNRCGHFFCNACWGYHIATQVQDGVTDIQCMDDACAVACSDEMVSVLAPASVSQRLTRFGVAAFTEICPLLKKCRNSNCTATIKMGEASLLGQDVTCAACGFLNCAR
jgi:ariadne-1